METVRNQLSLFPPDLVEKNADMILKMLSNKSVCVLIMVCAAIFLAQWVIRSQIAYQVAKDNMRAMSYVHRVLEEPALSSSEKERLLREGEKIDPTNPVIPLTYGMFLTNRNRYPEAIAAYERSIEIAPDGFLAYEGAAYVYEQTGENKKADQYALIAKSLRQSKNIAPLE